MFASAPGLTLGDWHKLQYLDSWSQNRLNLAWQKKKRKKQNPATARAHLQNVNVQQWVQIKPKFLKHVYLQNLRC